MDDLLFYFFPLAPSVPLFYFFHPLEASDFVTIVIT